MAAANGEIDAVAQAAQGVASEARTATATCRPTT